MRPLILLTIVALAGCHLLFGHSPGSGQSAGDGPGRIERGTLDRLARAEGVGDLIPHDHTYVSESGACLESEEFASGWTGSCPGFAPTCPKENVDCDALPGYRDLYGDCNELRYKQAFDADVLQNKDWTGYSQTSAWGWRCGGLLQKNTSSGADDVNSAVARDAALLPASTLVEARVTLGAAAKRRHWRVGVMGRVATDSGFHFIGCSIWQNPDAPAYNPVPDPDLVITVRNAETEKLAEKERDAWPLPHKKVPGLEALPGSSYVLQLWYTPDLSALSSEIDPCTTKPDCPAVVCRVCSNTSCFHTAYYAIYSSPGEANYLPAGPGTVGVRTLNRAATFDYVRVYELKNP